jgi:hypothetical protein
MEASQYMPAVYLWTMPMLLEICGWARSGKGFYTARSILGPDFLKVTYLPMGAFLPIAPWYPNVTPARIARRMKTILVTSVTGDSGKEGAKGISPQS